MDELTLDGKIYISSKRSAQITGYAKDYVGQLCREGRVEARLVGRNWYVLESSIREHRFGAEAIVEAAPAEIEANNTWKGSNYVSETIAEMPTIVETPSYKPVNTNSGLVSEYRSVNAFDIVAPEEKFEPIIADATTESPSPAIQEMQSAWHDWFSRTHESKASEEIVVESPEVAEESDENEENTTSLEDFSEEVSVQFEEDEVLETEEVEDESEDEEEEEESVPIHRTFAAPARHVVAEAPIRSVERPVSTANYMPERREVRPMIEHPEPQGRIIRERRVVTTRKGTSGAVRFILILVSIAAIVIAVLDSGKIDSYVSQYVSRFTPLQYLAGQSSFERVNK